HVLLITRTRGHLSTSTPPEYAEQLNHDEGKVTAPPSIQGEVLAITLNELLYTAH
ncbi:hypothetical protein A2U01_0085351, partial [Trifolium medium]|nr:hypothetical protein [Trifolium medium]